MSLTAQNPDVAPFSLMLEAHILPTASESSTTCPVISLT